MVLWHSFLLLLYISYAKKKKKKKIRIQEPELQCKKEINLSKRKRTKGRVTTHEIEVCRSVIVINRHVYIVFSLTVNDAYVFDMCVSASVNKIIYGNLYKICTFRNIKYTISDYSYNYKYPLRTRFAIASQCT